MPRLEINWQQLPDMPAEVRTAFEPMLTEYASLLPAWLLFLRVEFDASDGNEGAAAQINVRMEYCRATLTIGAQWMACDEAYRRKAVIHELLHITLDPMMNLVADFRDLACKAHPDLKDFLIEQARMANERVTTDLTWVAEQVLCPQ